MTINIEPSGVSGKIIAKLLESSSPAAGGYWQISTDENSIENPTARGESDTETFLQFKYEANTKTIELIGTPRIPEFSAWIVLPLLFSTTLLVILYKKRVIKTQN